MVNNSRYYGTFTFSKPLSELDLTRLGFYAPFIKYLDILNRPKDLKFVAGWNVLVDLVRSGHTLLPNLMTLQLKPPSGVYSKILPYLWATVFCSPSLKSLFIGGRLAEISPRTGSALLGFLADRCPNLDTLECPLVVHKTKSEQDQYIPPKTDASDHIPKFLQSTTLRNLATSSFFANRYLLEISQSPCLERLEIHNYDLNEVKPVSLPNGSFSALRELKLLHMNVLEVETFWKISELIGGLTTLECVLYSTSEDEQDLESYQATINFPLRFSNTLCSSSPYITDLTLNFDSEDCGLGEAITFLEANELQILAQLPLRKLSVDGASVFPASGFPVCRILASTFNSLEVLRWPCEVVECEDLPEFTTMPNLQYLAVGLRVGPNHSISNALSDTCLDRPLRMLEVDLSIYTRFNSRNDWYLLARNLACIWPNVQLTPRARGPSLHDYAKSRLSDDQYRILNEFMLLQRGLSDEQAISLWLRVSEEWFAARFPERPSWWAWADEE
ncbi:hypothetical protein BDV93DRAFT_520772 [Ceratobasidium sp. AG-I]|nr:hypothetical protein BDV93DRAFT_520772 [Ceratobasidium sp. AG-I]